MAIPILDQLLSPPIVYFVGFGVIIFLIMWLYNKYVKKEIEFEIEQLKDIVLEELDNRFKNDGLRTSAYLMRGIDYLAKINAWIHLKGQHETMKYDPAKKEYVKSNDPPVPYDLYLLRKPPTFWGKLLFRDPNTYFVIDKEHFNPYDPHSNSFNLKEDIQLYQFAGAFMSSQAGEEWITDISIKRSNENTLTYLMNYSKKIIFLELAHSKSVNLLNVKTGLKKDQWESLKKEAEDVEEEND